MSDWIKWLVRCAAAFLLGGLGAMFLLMGAAVADSRAAMLPIGGIMVLGSWLSWPRRPNAWRSDPPTERQVAYAIRLGIDIPPGISKGELSDLISQATGR